MLPGAPPDDLVLLIRAAPSTIEETVLDIAETALDSADTYAVNRPDGTRVALYGVSVLARRPETDPAELLRRLAASTHYLEASVGDIRSAGFDITATGSNPDHFEVLLVGNQPEGEPLLSFDEVEESARRLVAVARDLRSNPSYAGEQKESS